jgi:hypothetical protein
MKAYKVFLPHDCSLRLAKLIIALRIHCVEIWGLASSIVVFKFILELSPVVIP